MYFQTLIITYDVKREEYECYWFKPDGAYPDYGHATIKDGKLVMEPDEEVVKATGVKYRLRLIPSLEGFTQTTELYVKDKWIKYIDYDY